MQVLEVERGGTAAYTVTIRDVDGNPVTDTYTNETLTLEVWPGDDQEARTLTDSLAEWLVAADGTVTVLLDNADTASFVTGDMLRVYLDDGGEPYEVYRSWLIVREIPGAATAPTTKITFADMLRKAGDLGTCLFQYGDLSGFALQRNLAWRWLRRQLLARTRAIMLRHLDAHSPVVSVEPILITTGLDDGPDYGPSTYPQTDVRDAIDAIKTLLDDGTSLLLDPDDDNAALEAMTCYALAEVFSRPFVTSENGTNPYADRADCWYHEARVLLSGWTARIQADDVVIRVIPPVG